MARAPDVQSLRTHGRIQSAEPPPSWTAIGLRFALWLASFAFLAWISTF